MEEFTPVECLSEHLATAVVWRNLGSDPPPKGEWVMVAFRMSADLCMRLPSRA
jgi:hypothetical protein